ncbi:MAG: hypothetical protein GY755_05555 [Chloroflexi bacterium]|nr:hypothetical protein [Chloroflexota bacterium]
MNRKNISVILMLVGLLVSACTLSSAVATEAAPGSESSSQAEATSTQGSSSAETRPTKTPVQNTANTPSQPSGQNNSPPTTVPTKASSSGNSNSSGSSNNGPLTISNITMYPQGDVYYGNCGNGEETMANIQATLDPLDKVASATIYYAYNGPSGMYGNYSKDMYKLGIGDYAADIDVGVEADFPLQGNDGTLEVYIHAVDKDGNTVDSNWQTLNVWHCSTVGQPPQEDVALLSFTGPVSASAGDTITLEWEVLNACKVFLNGDEVAVHVGTYDYAIPSDVGGQNYGFTLTAWGNSCDNSSEVGAYHDMWIDDATQTTIETGSGNLKDSFSLDFGDGNGDDIIFDHRSDGTVLYTVWGSELKMYGTWEPSVAQCVSELNSGSFTEVHIDVYDYICYKTGSGNYGWLYIKGMFLDLDDRTNSYIDLSYHTEVTQ